ncbi:5-carboxy-2-oxohept-3-enedioate decarboxylase HpaG1 subunit [Pseudomonas sp. NFPP10]|jgi:5-oxopent-3-ene-1,2,5-tricarboxylate decarboxylase/2-hydroxyhepta-2,4-diene-1,7-dioate isomerase|uniref:fumarylacetoacetate hydrolase family protein n=1 Tax=Pseudomonas TaxID=286 RepID=UPI0008884921|nr:MULTISPECIES: fumarylacetoacetate hydrolase family protein [Pseudomonas]MCU1765230.1 fumarylacetoacetate hydrolase family protein [Pseudomonas protegens]SDA11499.1 5-carboxy-2-oxohept-3-enedioate decarboxylase HpaG1 subunit [Pseudomonas sp. NFPP12]SEK50880.1 5-carboxy-2-oxohept-3-enedioate decarboxylase HpaG1 subunit [Pseudomonas sp. NFPP10]SFH92460.1 5-carboxy-2-oxohept-3-enedioate decarboxylase HpaG1 subunit [Pseudomonas sp. NFPP08]SFM13351.1 5-carboxy-2-oxohept-3-enedioate decarboxylase 
MSRALNDHAGGTLFGVALNYQGLLQSHLQSFTQPPYQKPPVKPVLFIKTPNTRNSHEAPVVFPQGVERLQPGPALGVVIGKRASRVRLEDALEHVAGYTIVNEFSLPEDSYYRPAVKAKCRDGFCALGPELVPAAEVPAPHALSLELWVNGERVQHNSTANLVRSIPQLIAEISEFMTLHPGDVLITGTPEGRVDVRPGDRVEVQISGLGRLANTIVAE